MCIFCKIINKEIPSYKIYEDDYTYAFLDISDDVIGHTLVIPKKHYDNILDVDGEILSKVMLVAQKIAKHYVEDWGFPGVNILNNSGVDANQSVMHLHIHILPRKAEDGIKVYSLVDRMGSDFSEVCEKLKMKLFPLP